MCEKKTFELDSRRHLIISAERWKQRSIFQVCNPHYHFLITMMMMTIRTFVFLLSLNENDHWLCRYASSMHIDAAFKTSLHL